MTYFFTLFSEH